MEHVSEVLKEKEELLPYIRKSKKLEDAGFWMVGLGHFDITLKEQAKIIQLLEKDNFEEIDKLYEDLYE